MASKTQVNSAVGIMGVTGSGKSSLLPTLAKYVWNRWHKVSLYYNSDGGGFPAEVQACINVGIMRVFRMLTRDPSDLGLAFETCQRACQGWWPQRINPSTGEVPPGVPMIPPITVRFEQYCADGHLVKTVPSESLLQPGVCPTCKKTVTRQDMRVRKIVVPTKGFEDVGAVMYDGLTSMLAWEMREMGHRSGRMELKGEESAIGGKVISGDLKFGGTTRSHVGFVQSRGEELVHVTLGIPNLVVPPIFTMLTHEDVDDRALSIIGPKIAGRAKTDEAPQWFGNMLETAKIPAITGSGEQRILYLNEFTDARGVRHLCKHRGSPGTMPAYLIDPPEDPQRPDLAFTQFNLGVFFEMLDAALDRRIDQVKQEIPDAPGLAEGMVEVGEGAVVVEAASTQAVTQPVTSTGPAPIPVLQAPTLAAPKGRKRTAALAVAVGILPASAPVPPPAAPVLQQASLPEVPTPVLTPPPVAPLARPVLAPPAGARPNGSPAGVAVRGPAAAPRPPTLPRPSTTVRPAPKAGPSPA